MTEQGIDTITYSLYSNGAKKPKMYIQANSFFIIARFKQLTLDVM